MSDTPKGIICYWCKAIYTGRPSDHVCPNGETFQDRIAKRKLGGDIYHYGDDSEVDAYHRKLTLEDKAMLKGMKIQPD